MKKIPPSNKFAETASRALALIRDLGFVRRGQAKVRAMLEGVVESTDTPQQRQLASEVSEKLQREGNARARKFARELSACVGLDTPPPSTGTVSVTGVKEPGLRNLTSTRVTTAIHEMPALDERAAAELRRFDRTVALCLKRAVEDIEMAAWLIRSDSPVNAKELKRLAGEMDAQRKAWNVMATAIKVRRQHPPAR